jgi:hypothetical protein
MTTGAGELSGGCQEVVRKLSGGCQEVVRKSHDFLTIPDNFLTIPDHT